MARFDVYPNTEGAGYLLDVQADLLADLNTRIVIPLLPSVTAPRPAATLNPTFVIEGEEYIAATQFMAAVPARLLRLPVARVKERRGDITAAVDLLFQGF